MATLEYKRETLKLYQEAVSEHEKHTKLVKEHSDLAQEHFEMKSVYSKILRRAGIDPDNPPASLDDEGESNESVSAESVEQPTTVEPSNIEREKPNEQIRSGNKTAVVLSVFNGTGLLPKEVYDRVSKQRDDISHNYIWTILSKQVKAGTLHKEKNRYFLTSKGRDLLETDRSLSKMFGLG
jgi:hypothetical protein